MGVRHSQLLDAGLELVAAQGMGGLTHDAVVVRRAGARHPERDFGIMANYMTGLVFHELALPTPEFDPVERLRVLIDTPGWSAP